MKPQGQFCVGLRLLGIWQISSELQEGVYFLPAVRANLRMIESASCAYMYHMLACLFLGTVRLQGGPLFARLLFPDASVTPKEVEQEGRARVPAAKSTTSAASNSKLHLGTQK